MRRTPPFLVLAAGTLAGLTSCLLSKLDGTACSQDSDCPSSQSCLFDLSRSQSLCNLMCSVSDATCPQRCATEVNRITAYCTPHCKLDSDCPKERFCDDGTDVATSSAADLRLCVERVRTCQKEEVCNGLDNDCDGVIGGPNCKPITGCLDDAVCGIFTCEVPEGAADSICSAPNAAASIPDYMPCSSDGQCRNGLCETGFCAPLCRGGEMSNCRSDFFCARGDGAVTGSRAPHNVCQVPCVATRNCPVTGQHCVWRDVYGLPPNHAFVCSDVNGTKKRIGERCSGNTLAGDAECQDGLCFGNPPVCTRSCDHPGEDCTDNGPGFQCRMMTMLLYGQAIFIASLCVGPNG